MHLHPRSSSRVGREGLEPQPGLLVPGPDPDPEAWIEEQVEEGVGVEL